MSITGGGASPKEPAHNKRCRVQSLGWEDPLEESMATHSSIVAWRISCSEEVVGLQSIGLQRVIHDWSSLACTQASGVYWQTAVLTHSKLFMVSFALPWQSWVMATKPVCPQSQHCLLSVLLLKPFADSCLRLENHLFLCDRMCSH